MPSAYHLAPVGQALLAFVMLEDKGRHGMPKRESRRHAVVYAPRSPELFRSCAWIARTCGYVKNARLCASSTSDNYTPRISVGGDYEHATDSGGWSCARETYHEAFP